MHLRKTTKSQSDKSHIHEKKNCDLQIHNNNKKATEENGGHRT